MNHENVITMSRAAFTAWTFVPVILAYLIGYWHGWQHGKGAM